MYKHRMRSVTGLHRRELEHPEACQVGHQECYGACQRVAGAQEAGMGRKK